MVAHEPSRRFSRSPRPHRTPASAVTPSPEHEEGKILRDWSRALSARLNVRMLGIPILAYDEVTSTNDVLKVHAEHGGPEGLTVVAKTQTKGKGQQGRSWVSPAGQGVYMSVLLKPSRDSKDVTWLSVLVATATARAMQELGVPEVTLKWPNDVLAGGKKLAGILVEQRRGKDGILFAVLGIGVNARQQMEDWPESLRDTATSCRLAGVDVSCDDVIASVLYQLDEHYGRLKQEGTAFLRAAWEELSPSPLPL